MQKGLEKFIQKYYLPDARVRMAGISLFTVLVVDHKQKCSLEVVATGVLPIRGSDMKSKLSSPASVFVSELTVLTSLHMY